MFNIYHVYILVIKGYEMATELRWCNITEDKSAQVVYGRPTATDAIEFAETLLEDEEEFSCCKTDIRVPKFIKIRELLGVKQ